MFSLEYKPTKGRERQKLFNVLACREPEIVLTHEIYAAYKNDKLP
jgi:hypothetical protein